MTLQFKNNASTTLSGSINNTQTSITVASASGFPALSGADYFYATMYEVSGATEINIEIIKVTATSGAVWTIVRAQDGTTARSRDGITTCYIENRYTAASAAQMLQKDENLADIASAATARTNLGLGSMATQSASSVAITGGTISGVAITALDSTTAIADNIDPTKKVDFQVSGVTTNTTRTLTIPNASGTIALTSDLASYQAVDTDLTAIAGLSASGLIARTGAGTAAARAITQPAAGITVTNGDGVAGNPTLALANDLAGVESLNTTGFVRRTAADTWSAAAIADADIPGALTGKTYNGLSVTTTTGTLTVTNGKTLSVSNSLTMAGTDGTTFTFPAVSGTLPLNNQTFFLGSTSIAINRPTGALTLSGVSIDGSANSASTATSATTATNIAGGAANQLAVQSAAGSTTFVAAPVSASTYLSWNGTGFTWASPGGGGTVTSVGITSSDLSVSGSPVTGNGSITLGLNTVGIGKGGTGATTKLAAFDALSPMSTLGDLVYHDGTNNIRLAGNTTATKRFLRQTGNGSASAAPAWDTLVDGDVPTALTGKTYNGLTVTSTTGTLTVAAAKTLTASNTLTFAGTDGSTLNVGAGGTLGSAAFTASTAYAPTAGSGSITTVGTISSGTWQGSAIGITYGGTGATTKAAGFNALSPVTTLGDLIYGDGANSNTRLAGNTSGSKRFLTQTGTGTVSAAPGWNAIVDGDLPSALAGKTYNALTLTAGSVGFSIAGGTTPKTLQVNNNLTLSGTDGSTLNIGGGGTLGSAAYTNSTAYQPAGSYQALDADLTAIAALAGTSGFLKKTAADTWSLDTNTYLTGNQSISISGDASGSGTTSIALTLANTGVSASTYRSVTVDAKGRVTAGSNPTTLAGYGITDAQALDADLTAIAALAGTSGFLKKTAANTWSLDTNTYLTGNQSISISGDASGSGTTSIALTLANSGVTAGTYNNVTVNGKGLVTGGSSVSYLTGNQSISISGDASGSGTTSIALTLANSGVTAGTYTKLTVDGKGRVTAGSSLASGDLPTYTGSLTSTQVTNGLGYTPYNSTNPSGYITSSGSISGSAGSLSNTTSYMVNRGSVAAASIDTATANGFYTQSNAGDSNAVLVFDAGGSTGVVQQRFAYQGGFEWRNRTDNTTWTAWKTLLHSGNYTSYSPALNGTGASGTWGINVTGSAGSVAWTNVSGRPTAVSSFSNDSGYITSAGRAYPRRSDGGDLNFYWSGQSGQPTWLWGGDDGNNMYVYNPSNFNVNYAASAGAVAWTNVSGRPTALSSFSNDSGYITSSGTSANTSSISSAVGGSYTWTGTQNFLSSSNVGSAGSSGTLSAYGNSGGTNAAVMNFHRPGAYAINMGLDTDNVFRLGGWSDGSGVIRFSADSSGNFVARGNVTAYGSPSDIKLKENIFPLTGALKGVERLSGYRYNYKGKSDTLIGVIAQEVEQAFPELVYEFTNESGTETSKAVRYELLTAVLIEAVKELSARVKALEAR